jgi:hypothetical protein
LVAVITGSLDGFVFETNDKNWEAKPLVAELVVGARQNKINKVI